MAGRGRLIPAWSWKAVLPADVLDDIGTARQQELAGKGEGIMVSRLRPASFSLGVGIKSLALLCMWND